jgi:hypothetical protein
VGDLHPRKEALSVKSFQGRADRIDTDPPLLGDSAMHLDHIGLADVPQVLEGGQLEISEPG